MQLVCRIVFVKAIVSNCYKMNSEVFLYNNTALSAQLPCQANHSLVRVFKK